MPTVVPVRFKYNPKTYWYTYASDSNPQVGDFVVVEQEAGKVFGWVEEDPFEITKEQEAELKAPLKSIARVATDADYEMKEKLDEKGQEAKKAFRRLAEKHELDIKPIDVEYLIDTDKAIFHFSSEERVDFRELVRDLATTLHVHVDMKQIGVRDEARSIGGFGHCGEVLCCVRMSNAFQPVSIRMAKEQGLPLNPGKVSGACGRLMCCLRYEFEAYKDFKSRSPKVGAIIETPAGQAKVIELNTPKELVRLKMLEGDEVFYVPLAGMVKDPDSEQAKPNKVTEETFAENCPASMKAEHVFSVPEDELLEEAGSSKSKKRRKKNNKKRPDDEQPQRAESGQGPAASKDGAGAEEPGQRSGGKSRRSRSRNRGAGAQGQGGQQQNQKQQGERQPQKQAGRQRPGQKSSNIRNPQAADQQRSQSQGENKSNGHGRRKRGGQQPRAQQSPRGAQQENQRQQQGQRNPGAGGHRKPRRSTGGNRGGAQDGGQSGRSGTAE